MAGVASPVKDRRGLSDRVAGILLLTVGAVTILLGTSIAENDSCAGVGFCPTSYPDLARVVGLVGLVAAALGTLLLIGEERARHRRRDLGPRAGPTFAWFGTVVDRYCPRCGAGSPAVAGFCHRCGGPLPAPA